MILFKKASDLNAYTRQKQTKDTRIGLVPTMGALHQGHLSLIQEAKNHATLTVCSIFVNPTQFNDPKDFKKYPITIEKDIALLEEKGVNILFLPEIDEIYPHGTKDLESYDLGYLESVLEGKYRPGHFQGVCQVMNRLLTAVHPDDLFMGQKDYQQCMVIKKLLKITERKIVFHTCPTQRETDGLAMSSRNMRLTKDERKKAVAIYESLVFLRKYLRERPLSDLIAQARSMLEKNDFSIDYVAIADADTLEPVMQGNISQKLVALVAAFQQEVRLIDNMLLNQ